MAESAAPLLATLRAIVGEANVLTSDADVAPYVTDWRDRYHGRARAVVRPSSTAEVAAAVRCCAEHGVPLVPQGGNTGLCGGATPHEAGGEVVVSLSRLESPARDRRQQCDAHGRSRHAAWRACSRLLPPPGCCFPSRSPRRAVARSAATFPPMPVAPLCCAMVMRASSCSASKWSSLTAASGTGSGACARTTAVTTSSRFSSAAKARWASSPRRCSSSFPSRARPRPHGPRWPMSMPRSRCSPACAQRSATALPDSSSLAAPASTLLAPGFLPCPDPLPDHAWYVLVQADDAATDSPLAAQLEAAIGAAVEERIVHDVAIAQSVQQAEALWALREHIPEAQRLEGPNIKHDISLPVSRIPEFLELAQARARCGACTACATSSSATWATATCTTTSRPRPGPTRAVSWTRAAAPIASSTTWWHDWAAASVPSTAVGRLKRDELKRYKPAVEIDLMRRIKDALDPDDLLNPGKVV